MADDIYAQKCVEMVKNHENAIGVIAQSRLDNVQADFIQMTPGVQIESKGDHLGQTYNTPEIAIIGESYK